MNTRAILRNRDGYTYILALTIVMIMGIMLGMTGTSWKMIMQREREKELLFRGSQIKEAIENWYNPRYTVSGGAPRVKRPLTDLKDLLLDPYLQTKLRYLPQHYGAELDVKNPHCAPNCPKLKVYQDPMTGQEWDIIWNRNAAGGFPMGGIIGVASRSGQDVFRTDFSDTTLDKLTNPPLGIARKGGPLAIPFTGSTSVSMTPGKVRYRDWYFVADTVTNATTISSGYREGW